ncbi:uncharacterized protein MELLADRAFT_109069 [Melampsora larici-populina 98AG31]|uniref:Uncharacterized protein n=1 Tax=Melampsora larici-populina (strain 98AG31 / pathotype 3-4-7) TaxID=747676 RepID=F4RV82_MELLP|nr:uncharacterized protein MELLADRAFT_109069 [Melampsora larici-populina 98AG31]EGG03575.1 hypothetical protein MELLADRAFT_109069 [Melampsora larici-populina 98AG31]
MACADHAILLPCFVLNCGTSSGPLKVLTDERVEELITTGQGPGKIDTFDRHMNDIVKKPSTQIDFRTWIIKRNGAQDVEIRGDSNYAERDFIDHLLAWHKDKWMKKANEKKKYPSAEKIKKTLNKYPFSLSETSKVEHIPEPFIPYDSYLKNILMTPGEFIERYLPRHDAYRSRFWARIQQEFPDSEYNYASESLVPKAYWTSDIFTRYEKFALEELNQWTEKIPRFDFIDRYVPDIKGLRLEFEAYLNSIPKFLNPETRMRAKEYMPAYLAWAKKVHMHTERFFSYGQGEYRLKEPFIKYLYKKGATRGLSPQDTYFHGDIHAEYSAFLYERKHANFAKKMLYKFQEWKYNLHLGWTAFKNSFSNLDGWDKFFLGMGAAELGDIFVRLFAG